MTYVGWIFAILAALVLVVAFFVASRLRSLGHRVGSFECSVVPVGPSHPAPVKGIAHYGVGRLDWWRRWSLSPRPAESWSRGALEVVSRDLVEGDDEQYVVRCSYQGDELVLIMSVQAYAGLTSWLESAPPSSHGAVA
jgi:hypothetical protein